jgi:hypothetical protein
MIAKEKIGTLHFVQTEVLEDIQEITIRSRKLKRAEQLGNIYKTKSKIAFKTLEGLFRVETTVWATTEKFVSLKGGILIPIHCIKGVEFY